MGPDHNGQNIVDPREYMIHVAITIINDLIHHAALDGAEVWVLESAIAILDALVKGDD